MSDFKRYYEEELRYLTEGGKEFASSFPDIASYLNLNAVEDRDPYVERLFEGFAFLAGRIRQKLDDDFPEVTENLLEIIAPNFLRPLPSLALLQFQPRPGIMQKSYTVPKGTIVLSNPVGESLTTCRFQTTQDVAVHPIMLSNLQQLNHPSKGHGLKFTFTIDEGAESTAAQDGLSVYIHGDRSLAWMLHYLLTEKVSEIILESEDRQEQISLGNGPLINAGGFSEDQNLLPRTRNGQESGRFLHEFFAFEEKFRFVDFSPRLFSQTGESTDISLTVYFSEAIPKGKNVKRDHFKLHVSPIVNVFEHQAEPVFLDNHHFEYRLIAKSGEPYEVFEVTQVKGVSKSSGAQREYLKFPEFRHAVSQKGGKAAGRYYSLRRESTEEDIYQCYLSMGQQGGLENLQQEYLSISLLSTNGSLPRKEILEKGICNPVSGFPEFMSFSNITRPTTSTFPPQSKHYLWTVLSHLNMNFRTLSERGMLQEVLSLYDWRHSGTVQKLVRGISKVSAGKKSVMLESQLVHGTGVTVTFKEGTFGEEGEQNIFGRVLLEFLTQYSSINHLVSLEFITEPSGARFSWEPRLGTCHSI
jgi:type VI secretion system protein ImpG